MPAEVLAVFDAIAPGARERLLWARGRILSVATATEGVGKITETLRWGQPSYLTDETKSGSTLRLGLSREAGDAPALFVICQTSLADQARALPGNTLTVIGNRVILVPGEQDPAFDAVIRLALTYKLK